MFKDKANVICLLKILQEYSDENHIMPMRDIISKLKSIYNLDIDRRTVYSAVDILQALGYDISTYKDNNVGYYLRERDFELSEIRLITDAIYSFPFISVSQTRNMITRLQKLRSKYESTSLKHLTVIRNSNKTTNTQVFFNIEILDEAIEKGVRVSFTYLKYNKNKHLVPRRDKPYVVSPYSMIYTNEHYYLVCKLTEHSNISFYRIDRISDIKILEEKSEYSDNYNEEAVNSAIYAFIQPPEKIQFTFNKNILNDVIDRFGTDISIIENDDQYTAIVDASPKGMLFWALQYLQEAEVLKPDWLREKIIAALNNNKYKS